jgi:ribonuclease HI
MYLGRHLSTNNEAEATALANAVTFATNNAGKLRSKVVRVIGDSQLLASFM